MSEIVVARGVRKTYRGGADVEALKGVDFEAAPGMLTAIVGPSGSGKTTLLNCLSGLEHIDEGSVLVHGTDLASMSDNNRTTFRANSMGFVFQAFNLLPVLTAAENVEIPLLLQGASAGSARERAHQALAQVGLEGRGNHRPDQLSGGEQQRVTIARALVHKPSVVFADEPTGNLDSETSDAVMRLFETLAAGGETIVMVTHDRGLAARAGSTVSMRDGLIESVT